MRLRLFFLVVTVGITIFLIRTYIRKYTPTPTPPPSKNGDVIFFLEDKIFTVNNQPIDLAFSTDKTIILNPTTRELTFPAQIRKTKGKVLFLINLKGYYWLDDNSALISDVSLTDFKNALAYLDWKNLDMWRTNNPKMASTFSFVKVTITQGDTKSIDGRDAFVISESDKKSLSLQRLIFAGDPLLDNAIISNQSHARYSILPDCSSCPLLPTEKELILKQYANRELTLNEKLLSIFDKNKTLQITVHLPR